MDSQSERVRIYDFPLYPGKRWSSNSTQRDIKTGHVREHKIVAEVAGWETITVPAGTFRTIKVMIRNEVKDTQTGQITTGSDVSWYAPAAKRSVKYELRTFKAKDGQEDDVQNAQVVRYKLAIPQDSKIPSPRPKSGSKKPEKIINGAISGYECGDNCYLTIVDKNGVEHTGLCIASPLCDKWNQETIMPNSFNGREVKVTIGKGTQIDGAGNEMGIMDAFTRIHLLN
jgi:hypothetical protein